MALVLIQNPPLSDTPKAGCGLIYKLEEDDYVLTAGIPSQVQISFGVSGALTNGDSFVVNGIEFTMKSIASADISEIAIGSPPYNTTVQTALLNYPFIEDNYDVITGASDSVIITAKIVGVDDEFGYSFSVANAGAIELTPLSVPAQGTDAIVKSDYVVLMDLFDTNGDKVCQDPLTMDLSVFYNGDNAVCFDVEQLICSLPDIFTAPPLPRQPILQGADAPTNFDEFYSGEFSVRFYNSYQDAGSLTCERITDSRADDRLNLVNMIQPVDYVSLGGANIFQDLYTWSIIGDKNFITAMPDDYKICKSTPFELRYDLSAETINNSLGGPSFLQVTVYYTDFDNENYLFNIEDLRDGIHVANISLGPAGSGDNSTVPLARYHKDVARIYVHSYFFLFGVLTTVAERNIYVDNSSNGRCCGGCSKAFYFLSSLGNNDVLVARCETDIDIEVEFNKFCKEVECGGETYYGVRQFNGGRVDQTTASRAKIYKVYFESSDPDYLEEFLTAPVKYVYEDEKIYRIYPTNGSYKIYQKNSRTYMEFDYVKSINPFKKSLTK